MSGEDEKVHIKDWPPKECPCCGCCLVLTCLIAQLMVLHGNTMVASALSNVGDFADGWADVGLGASNALRDETDKQLENATDQLEEALSTVIFLSDLLDGVLVNLSKATDNEKKKLGKGPKGEGSLLQMDSVVYADPEPTSPVAAQELALAFDPSKDMHAADMRSSAVPDGADGVKAEIANSSVEGLASTNLTEEASKIAVPEDGAAQQEETAEESSDTSAGKNETEETPEQTDTEGPSEKRTTEKGTTETSTTEKITTATSTTEKSSTEKSATEETTTAGPEGKKTTTAPVDEASTGSPRAPGKLTDAEVDAIMKEVRVVANEATPVLTELLFNGTVELVKYFAPAKALLDRLSGKVLKSMNAFGKSLKQVHSTVSEFMLKFGVVTKGEAHRFEVLNTSFHLYDVNKDGFVSLKEIGDAADTYGMAEVKENVQDSFNRYATDMKAGEKVLSELTFPAFCDDPKTPNVTATALGFYGRRLLDVGEEMNDVRTRAPAASMLARCFEASYSADEGFFDVVAREVQNGSAGIRLPADVLISLCGLQSTFAEYAGARFLRDGYTVSAENATKAADKISNTSYWAVEKFNVDLQPACMKKVTKWLADAKASADNSKTGSSLLSEAAEETADADTHSFEYSRRLRSSAQRAEALAGLAQRLAEKSVMLYKFLSTQERAKAAWEAEKSPSYKALIDFLENGDSLAASVSTSQDARVGPEVSSVLKDLSTAIIARGENITKMSDEYEGMTEMDRVANKIEGLVDKLTEFVHTVVGFASSDGEKRLNETITHFVSFGVAEALVIVEQYLRDRLTDGSWLPQKAEMVKSQTKAMGLADGDELLKSLSDTWEKLAKLLFDLNKYIKKALKILKDARVMVVSASRNSRTVFLQVKAQGPQIFWTLGDNWKTLWTVLIGAFLPFYFIMMFYACWAGGYCGGPTPLDRSEHPPADTCGARCSACCRYCCNCQRECHDTTACMFSWVFFMQILVLVLFILALIITLLFVFEFVFGTLCTGDSVAVVSNTEDCQNMISPLKEFFPTFRVNYTSGSEVPFENVCEEKNLMVCGMIASKMKNGALASLLGGFLAVCVMFELIIEFAKYHEMVKYRRKAKMFSEDVEAIEVKHGHGEPAAPSS